MLAKCSTSALLPLVLLKINLQACEAKIAQAPEKSTSHDLAQAACEGAEECDMGVNVLQHNTLNQKSPRGMTEPLDVKVSNMQSTYMGCYSYDQLENTKGYGHSAAVNFNVMYQHALTDNKLYFGMARHSVGLGHAWTMTKLLNEPKWGHAPCGTKCHDEANKFCGCANEGFRGYPNKDCQERELRIAVYRISSMEVNKDDKKRNFSVTRKSKVDTEEPSLSVPSDDAPNDTQMQHIWEDLSLERPLMDQAEPPNQNGNGSFLLEDEDSMNRAGSQNLKVTIVKARDLETQWWGNRDPYVEFYFRREKASKMRTPTVNHNQNPVWDFAVVFTTFRAGDRLEFHVWDDDHGYDDHLGSSSIYPKCSQTGTKTLRLDKQGTLTVKIECAVPSRVDLMARMADDSYTAVLEKPKYGLGGWSKVGWLTFRSYFSQWKKDNMILYRKGNECTMAFSGSNDPPDWLHNLRSVRTRSLCGYDIHRGIAGQFIQIMTHPYWPNYFDWMNGNCAGGIYATGHSLGGALATNMTVCVNQQGRAWLNANKLRHITVKEVYTIGAPAVATQPFMQNGGCLQGLRVYNEDEDKYDPVPYVFQHSWNAYKHPKQKALRLIRPGQVW